MLPQQTYSHRREKGGRTSHLNHMLIKDVVFMTVIFHCQYL